MKRIKISIITAVLFMIPIFVSAQGILDKLKTTGETTGPFQQQSDPQEFLFETIGNIISIFTAILAIIFIILIILAGYNYMTAQGDDAKIKQALSTIRHAVIGLVIVVSSYAITNFILERLSE